MLKILLCSNCCTPPDQDSSTGQQARNADGSIANETYGSGDTKHQSGIGSFFENALHGNVGSIVATLENEAKEFNNALHNTSSAINNIESSMTKAIDTERKYYDEFDQPLHGDHHSPSPHQGAAGLTVHDSYHSTGSPTHHLPSSYTSAATTPKYIHPSVHSHATTNGLNPDVSTSLSATSAVASRPGKGPQQHQQIATNIGDDNQSTASKSQNRKPSKEKSLAGILLNALLPGQKKRTKRRKKKAQLEEEDRQQSEPGTNQ